VLDARRFAIGLLAAAALGTAVAGGLHSWRDRSSADDSLRKARWMEDVMFGRAAIGGSFTLTDTSGLRRSLSEFRGRIVLLYFGYTSCPDVCPTDLLQIADVLKRLGPQTDQVQALFVTFDPERDTPKHLHSYLKDFDPRVIGLTGTPAEIASVAQSWRVFYEKVPMGDGNYLIDHSAYTFLIDQEGRYAGVFPPGTEAHRMLGLLKLMLR
jgi:cytochrome oxidase Cu insertion factor (SCO1/SenC/PrrC family)